MKEKVIEAAGKTWKFLGQNGETELSKISRFVKEKDPVVYQALGWLAREDKISYCTRSRKTFVSLVETELAAFNNIVYNMNCQIENGSSSKAKRNAKN